MESIIGDVKCPVRMLVKHPGHGALVTTVGLGAGLAGAMAMTRLMSGLLFR